MKTFNKNISWDSHIRLIENKVPKNIGILYKAKHVLNRDGRKSLHFSFIHLYLNYGNIVWRSTNKTNKKRLASKQKQAAAVIMNNEPLNINDIMKELIPKRLQTENLSSTHIYILH